MITSGTGFSAQVSQLTAVAIEIPDSDAQAPQLLPETAGGGIRSFPGAGPIDRIQQQSLEIFIPVRGGIMTRGNADNAGLGMRGDPDAGIGFAILGRARLGENFDAGGGIKHDTVQFILQRKGGGQPLQDRVRLLEQGTNPLNKPGPLR